MNKFYPALKAAFWIALWLISASVQALDRPQTDQALVESECNFRIIESGGQPIHVYEAIAWFKPIIEVSHLKTCRKISLEVSNMNSNA